MDIRREVREVWKHFGRYQDDVGETIIYYRFDVENSAYDNVYDEGFRRYEPGVWIPILWVDESEATEDYAPEGRRPTQRVRVAVSALDVHQAGLSVAEVHGNRLTDESPSIVWRYDRVHDIFYYSNRYYEVSSFQVRGRAKGEDVIVGITGIETYPEDDALFDYLPGSVSSV